MKIAGVVGDYSWEQTRDVLMLSFFRCKNEKDLSEVLNHIIRSIGTYKDLKKLRKKIGLPKFTKEEKKKMMEKIKDETKI